MAGRVTSTGLPYERFQDCTHCGLCLPYCPTYRELGVEMDSPRGRIYLVKALEDGRVGITEGLAQHLDLCVGCRACETACPSDVAFGRILEHGRSLLGATSQNGGPLPSLLYDRVLPWKARLTGLGRLLQLYQRSPLHRLIPPPRFQRLLSPELRQGWDVLTSSPAHPEADLPLPPPPENADGPTVALLVNCMMRVLLTEVNAATLRVLSQAGCRVAVPEAQECCGALHAHAGRLEWARELARVNIRAFEASGAEVIVTNSAGCGAHLKEYSRLFSDEPEWAARAEAFSAKVRDVSEFLASRSLEEEQHSLPLRVAYDDPCHLVHGQGIRDEPRQLLDGIPDLDLVSLHEAEWCCGSAGTYMFTQPDMAQRLLQRKLEDIQASGASVVATGNPGCLLWIGWGLEREGLPIRAVHPVQLLDESLSGSRTLI